MRIALLGTRGIPARYSGFETFYQELSLRLVERGARVTVYCRTGYAKEKVKEFKGVELVYLPCVKTKHLETFTHTLVSIGHALYSRHDIFYICIVGNSPLCWLLKLFGKKVILNVDGADSEREKWQGFAKTYLRWAERVAVKVADVIIADCKVIYDRYQLNYKRETMHLPYGANVYERSAFLSPTATQLLDKYGLKSDQYVLFVARLTPENKVDTLIHAYNKLAASGLKLAIVGDSRFMDAYHKEIKSLAANNKNVKLLGYQFGEAYKILSANCRYFVLPSMVDGTRPVLLDQMGMGNCVLVCDSPANMEVIGDCGYSFSRLDPVDDLARQMQHLERDVALVTTLRRKAHERAKQYYSWEDVADRYAVLFSKLQGDDVVPARGES